MTVSEEEGRFTLWQLPEQSDTQMMSYIIRAADGKLIVIDGGTQRDAGYLKGFVAALGESVEAWFLTHPHSDHTDALVEILRRPGGIAIGTIYVSLPDLGWIRQYGSNDEQDTPMRLEAALKASGIHVVELSAGQEVSVGGVRTEVLRVWNPGIHANALNNASLVLRVSDGSKSVLFTGDLGIEGGQELLAGPLRDRLRADYCQMAHHGQNGVTREFYEAVSPTHCLWPTPRWLWENNAGRGPGTGPWRTLEVRAWMDEMGLRSHFVSADGLHRIE